MMGNEVNDQFRGSDPVIVGSQCTDSDWACTRPSRG